MEDDTETIAEWIIKTAEKISKREGIDKYRVQRAIMWTLITGKRIYIAVPRKGRR